MARKFFLYGYYGFGNVGDDLLLASIESYIRMKDSNVQFIVRSFKGSECFSDKTYIHFTNIEHILHRQDLSKPMRLLCYVRLLANAMKGCGCFIFGGGTVFHARSSSTFNLLLIALTVALARLRAMRIFAIGVGVGKLPSGLTRWLMSFILYLSEDFAVRDNSSYENCRGIIGFSRIRHTADLVFSLPIRPAYLPKQESFKEQIRIGISLSASDIGFEREHGNFYLRLTEALHDLIRADYYLIFYSFQELKTDCSAVSDTALFERATGGAFSAQIRTISASSHIEELAEQFSSLDIVIGMRFHSLVVAALIGKPFIGLGRDDKLRNLCETLGMPFLSIDAIEYGDIVRAVQAVKSIKPDMRKVQELKNKSLENFVHLEAVFQ